MSDDKPKIVRPGLWVEGKYLKEVKEKLRAKVPKITLFDIRSQRQSHYEAIIGDLYEGGYLLSAQFLEGLIAMEGELKAANKLPELYLKSLKGKNCLLTIGQYLKTAELKLHETKKIESLEIVVQLAENLAEQEQQLWIVEQIYMASLRATKAYRLDGGLFETKVRYYYGRFLMEKCGLYDVAYEILKIAHQMSVAREWNIELGTGLGKDLCAEVNYLLFMCLSEKEAKQPPAVALEYSKRALKHALASENKYIIPRAYIERGDREMDVQNFLEASTYYSKAITFAQVSSQPDFICQGYLKKGYALQKQGQVGRATSFAKLAKRASEDTENKFYLAKSYMLFGEIAVNRAFMTIAGYNFMLAADLFNELKNDKLAREARFLGAFAMSHYVLEQLVELIKRSDQSRSKDCFRKLVLWKERRIPFWESEESMCNLKKISDASEMERRKFLLVDFGFYESTSSLEKRNLSSEVDFGSHRHIYQEFREWHATF